MAICVFGVVLFLVKISAYYITHSLSILSDALESIVNVIAGFVGLFSLFIAAKPKDENHPYGHGKAEFVSAAVEGALIIAAGCMMVYQTVHHLLRHDGLESIGTGLAWIFGTALVNFFAGQLCLRVGGKNASAALVASGKHLIVDTYSTLVIVVSLLVVYYTNWHWLDTATSICAASYVFYNGYHIIRSSMSGIMDEADMDLLKDLIRSLNTDRLENWIDLHNLRIIKYGSMFHLDCHLTVPWFLNVKEANQEVRDLERLIAKSMAGPLEVFVHTDGCQRFSCGICTKKGCAHRAQPFAKKVEWKLANLLADQKHHHGEGVMAT